MSDQPELPTPGAQVDDPEGDFSKLDPAPAKGDQDDPAEGVDDTAGDDGDADIEDHDGFTDGDAEGFEPDSEGDDA